MEFICRTVARPIASIRASDQLLRNATCRLHAAALLLILGEPLMLDVIYLLIGAVFLGGCILYAKACDKL